MAINSIFFFTILLISAVAAAGNHHFSRNLSPASLKLKKEKLTHLHFYFHDTLSGPNPTTVQIAQALAMNTSATFFGAVMALDDPLTVGPDPSSKIVGRAQGVYQFASQSELALLMVMNLVFTEGKYNGSCVSVLGRNAVTNAVREMPIVGGSGRFRFARGYAEAKTRTFDPKTGDAVVEYDIYVLHY